VTDCDCALLLDGVSKAFSGHRAVEGLSIEVPRGSVFGLLGPNGAGKTTTLRMVMNIFAPDSGRIEILGHPADHAARDRIGYMPEERGMYPRMVLGEQILFLAAIKGLGRSEALRRLPPWLERMGLSGWEKKKTNELSKGMQQKAQFIATVLHEPDVLILDEPMSGLDPVGMDTMREAMLDLSRRGATLVLSSHQMDTVERLCDRVALIESGHKVLDGTVRELKASRGDNTLALAYEGDGSFLASLPGVEKVTDFGHYVEIRLADGTDAQPLLREAMTRLRLRRFEIVEPSLHDIFVETVTQRARAREAA
jgi:ABC-2 type transport system ATP-binding protein